MKRKFNRSFQEETGLYLIIQLLTLLNLYILEDNKSGNKYKVVKYQGLYTEVMH